MRSLRREVQCCRPRTGRETSRNNANQREPMISQNGRPETVSGRLRRSAVWGASIWGTEGREFKSPQPDKQIPSLNRHFAVSGVSRRTAEVRSGREQAARRWKWRPGQSTSGRMPPGNGPEASRCWTTRPRRSMIPRLSSMWPVWSGPQSHRATRPSTMASMDST